MKMIMMVLPSLLLLTACGEPKKDYDAIARCADLGLKPGTAPYDDCISNERAAKMLKLQREEFERSRQEQNDWKMRRY